MSCGPDLVKKEMIKTGSEIMLFPLKTPFNLIVLSSGQYPTMWINNWLEPPFKGGDQMDTNGYRRITLPSCLTKLFCSVLNNQLTKYLYKT